MPQQLLDVSASTPGPQVAPAPRSTPRDNTASSFNQMLDSARPKRASSQDYSSSAPALASNAAKTSKPKEAKKSSRAHTQAKEGVKKPGAQTVNSGSVPPKQSDSSPPIPATGKETSDDPSELEAQQATEASADPVAKTTLKQAAPPQPSEPDAAATKSTRKIAPHAISTAPHKISSEARPAVKDLAAASDAEDQEPAKGSDGKATDPARQDPPVNAAALESTVSAMSTPAAAPAVKVTPTAKEAVASGKKAGDPAGANAKVAAAGAVNSAADATAALDAAEIAPDVSDTTAAANGDDVHASSGTSGNEAPAVPHAFSELLAATQSSNSAQTKAPAAAQQTSTGTSTSPSTMPPEAQFAQANHAHITLNVAGQLLPNGGSMQIRLDPPELGALSVKVEMRNGMMVASFETQNDQATRLLSHSLGDLRASLESQGVSVEKLHVQQAPRQQSTGNENRQSQEGASQDSGANRDQQRREMLRRMWQKLGNGQDPLDLVA